MATTFTQLRADFFARGFDPMNDGGTQATRADRWLNASYLTLCARGDFPWLYADASGPAPLTIADLRDILSVTTSTGPRQLYREDRRTLLDRYPNLSTAGTALYFYRDSASVVKVYPTNTTDTLTVRYLKKPAALASGSDAVIVPDEWADLIVDGAVLRAKRGKDDFDQFVAQYEVDVQRMVLAEVDDETGELIEDRDSGLGFW